MDRPDPLYLLTATRLRGAGNLAGVTERRTGPAPSQAAQGAAHGCCACRCTPTSRTACAAWRGRNQARSLFPKWLARQNIQRGRCPHPACRRGSRTLCGLGFAARETPIATPLEPACARWCKSHGMARFSAGRRPEGLVAAKTSTSGRCSPCSSTARPALWVHLSAAARPRCCRATERTPCGRRAAGD